MKRTNSQLITFVGMTVLGLAPVSVERGAIGQAASVAGAAGILDSAPIKFDRLDPAIDQIIPKGAMLERIADDFKWVEGPIWVNNELYFAEIPSNSIRKWTPNGGVSIFLQPSGYMGPAPYGGPESGSNGMTLDVRGRLTVAGHAQRDVYRFESLDPNRLFSHALIFWVC